MSRRQDITSESLVALTKDVSALLALSYEAAASAIGDLWGGALVTVGASDGIGTSKEPLSRGESWELGRSKALVILGCNEVIPQALTLQLAKQGYTLFPFISITPSSSSSSPLPDLLQKWSVLQKRLRAQHANHSGAVVPVIVDPDGAALNGDVYLGELGGQDGKIGKGKGKDKEGGRFAHGCDTVRAYCHENKLVLSAIICPNFSNRPPSDVPKVPCLVNGNGKGKEKVNGYITEKRVRWAPGDGTGLLDATEKDLLRAYRLNVLDPLSVIRELQDTLFHQGGGRIVLLNTASATASAEWPNSRCGTKTELFMESVREEMAGSLRNELGRAGVKVCEVMVGPLSKTALLTSPISSPPKALPPQNPSHPPSSANRLITLNPITPHQPPQPLINTLFLTDPPLLHMALSHALTDVHPRKRLNAGLKPVLEDLCRRLPGGWVLRWVLGRGLRAAGGGT
ncbi:hypothetical protein L198_07142 [Cryptococcus wingfieldii CBS 7118]|uniref:Uncharacterized protein n=1 Tax=Cryptococcus wingfieldii CBS 7118 TaxID=1295528 RepID=A0A1E3IEX0_9TREE|nr:hypothetical protein L198_07142 [Cryptococcus wingfieldii CBS 7118]ODN87140.1 hypothetical protein L198_07142 [Cryptococcus wingfieldii CBS 7118]